MPSMLKRLYDYVEIPTKLASVIPFFTALAYCLFLGYPPNLPDTVLFFAAMLLFDMTTTMINNYIDTRKSGQKFYFSRPVMAAMIFAAALPAAAIGVYLSAAHGPVFLLAGIFCFFIGITYTAGPAPISRSPYGEFFSGLTLGLVLPFLIVTINTPGLVFLSFYDWSVSLVFDTAALAKFVLSFAPVALCISNVMLANNICDHEADKHTRYTLPRHIGIKNALRLFLAIYVLCYIAIIASAAIAAIPRTALFVLPTAALVFRNVKRFMARQEKSRDFSLSIKNFLTLCVPYIASIFTGVFLTVSLEAAQ